MWKKLLAFKKKHPVFLQRLLLLLIFVLAAYLRFFNLNWDEGYFFHPDERNISAAVSRIEWPAKTDPQFYAYNGLPIFLIEITSQVMATITKSPTWLTDWSKLNLIGRIFSATFSLLSVVLIYLLSKKVFRRPQTTNVVTFLAATTVSFFQYAHYGVTESLLVLEILLLAFFSLRLLEQKKQLLSNLIFLAIILGCSWGTKTAALAFTIIPLSAIFLLNRWRLQTYYQSLFLLFLAGVIFYLVSPSTLQHLDQFRASMDYEGGVVRGDFLVPYTMQFIATPPYLFQLKNLLWQTSPLLMLLAGLALFFLGKHYRKYRLLWPLFFFSLLYFLYVGSWHAKFIRYMLPIIPALLFLAGVTLENLKNNKWRFCLTTVLVISSLLWSLAFFSIFQRPSTRLAASDWIYQQVPNGSSILTEHWDNGLPSTSRPDIKYQKLELKPYDEDNPEKISILTENLAAGDYLFIASRRLYGSIARNEQYPYTQNYYRLLFAGELGYQKVAQFSSYPQLFGLSINDDQTEETFQVFDHPTVMIWQNVGRLSQQEMASKILELNSQ